MNPEDFISLTTKGCNDHILCLASKEAQKTLCQFFATSYPCLQYKSKETIAMSIVRYIAARFRKD